MYACLISVLVEYVAEKSFDKIKNNKRYDTHISYLYIQCSQNDKNDNNWQTFTMLVHLCM